ncbi:MAG: lysine 2,3-aminomutase [Nitrospirae bacterium]|nr:MAG: lysine 2,3-aminomutase [Nitrospirota bacterium]
MKRYQAYTRRNFREIPEINRLPEEMISDIDLVSRVFPFKTNNYVVENLINWNDVPYDPMFILNFPQRGMLLDYHYNILKEVVKKGNEEEIRQKAHDIQLSLNPHPAGQLEYNIPNFKGRKLNGIQHKYEQTVLFLPSRGQTCHAYCTFCFRWPQFIGDSELKIGAKDVTDLLEYLRSHKEVTDVLFTGGDPLVMKASTLSDYLTPLLDSEFSHIRNIRFGTRVLTYWPDRFITDEDSSELLSLFRKIIKSGKHLAFMAQFNHPVELTTSEVQEAIARIRETGAEIRTQSPVLKHINNNPELWAEMWQKQVELGCIPYYMFMVRDTGAQHYFGVPIIRAHQIYREAVMQVSGLGRTVRGPVMSTTPGKIQILGPAQVEGYNFIVLTFLQARNPEWVMKPFFAEYDEDALWLDDLMPAFGKRKFFFEDDDLEYEPLFRELGN